MKTNKMFIMVLTLAFTLATVPAFAQRGLGVGGVLGGHAGVNTGGAVSTATGQVGAATSSAAGAAAGAGAKAGNGAQANTAAQAAGGAGIVTHIDSNPQLAGEVHSMLPSGTSLSSAAAGFSNEGQFLAALHASQNLGIPFDQLKAKMTGSSDMSLGAAIHASRPGMSEHDAKEEAKKAEREAKKQMSAKASANANTKPGRANVDADEKTSVNASAGTSVKR
jgi:hypothetical protein